MMRTPVLTKTPESTEPKTFIDVDELTVRIAEACMGNKRPAGMSALDALVICKRLNPEAAAGFARAALAAANYIAECVNAVNPGQVEVTIMPYSTTKGVM